MEKFSFSGLWKHLWTTVPGVALILGDAVLSYFDKIALPTWAHALVAVAGAALLFFKGKAKPVEEPPAA